MQWPSWAITFVARPLALGALLIVYHQSPVVGLMLLSAMFGFVVGRPCADLRRAR